MIFPPGITLTTKLAVAALFAIAVFGSGYACYRWAYNRGVDHERGVWQEKVQEAAVKFAEELERQQGIIERQAGEIQAARRQSNSYRESLEGALANDPPSRDWGAIELPGPVRLQLEAASRPGLPEDTRPAD